ncbi:mariner-Tc1 transposon family protein [Coccidioides posadasii C735 delta SOWgp]|uniref:Mariner-Tc1 transposon family protein n=1 Tax=Coccidioides posadasii (strain C735) TaxID=222929 RepID=C5NZ77_COCP7|nr:mariner-Tc1 transposon family protein [Coccidioides posadasii C735 delta SOWgp]EER30060.1 mariner-Tc1 transposon family protein [Coccidioides posadasii C735 delta SOWgp]|eukprot:XP_003072205.1 mariner-Tc1 transposon family protein [Coccidioides posadasii C735 delta SOWgp]
MPPTRNKNAKSSIEIEGRIELAISTLKKQEISSIAEAARLFNVPYTTLYHRANGRPARISLRANSTKLTETEEDQLVQWILDLAKQGIPPRPASVENMANHLLAIRDPTSPPPRVGQNWVSNLIKRRTELKCCYSRPYNWDRAKCDDRKVIQQLDIQLRTPTPPASQSSNSRQLHTQVDKIKNLMGQELESSTQGLMEGFDQIIKACEYGMVNATIMKKQYQDIFATNEKEKQKCTRSKR